MATLAYAASYFARGYVAGHGWFGLYGGLVLFESISRFCFPVAVAAGLASGQTAVALGVAGRPARLPARGAGGAPAPRRARARAGRRLGGRARARRREPVLRAGAGFALAVAGIQLAEQTLLNAAVLTVRGTSGAVLAGVVFNALLITRAPLQLFQAVQTSLLPHLSGLEATDGQDAFARTIRTTMLASAAFAGAVALGLLVLGPWVMEHVLGSDYAYGRVGLAVIALGMGCHLCAGTLNQAALARGPRRPRR